MKIVSVVPIKLNNERLPGKNTKLLGGKPLVDYIQDTLLNVPSIAQRYIYCSNISICNYLREGIEFLRRPEYLDSATTNFTQIFTEFSKSVDADIYIYTHATAPFISAATISECIDKVASGDFDSAFTAEKIQDFLWQDGKPLNFDASNLPRSQDLPIIYRETSGVYVFRKEVFEKYRRRIGEQPYIKEVSGREAVDINIPSDFMLAELYLEDKK